MYSKSQLVKAAKILKELYSNGNISGRVKFDSLFKDELSILDKEQTTSFLMELRFIEASLNNDLKLIRIFTTKDEKGISDFTALTKNGVDAHKTGLEQYLIDLERQENLEKEKLKLSVLNAQKAKKRSNWAMFISLIVPITIALITSKCEDENSNKTNHYNCNGDIRIDSCFFAIPDSLAVKLIAD